MHICVLHVRSLIRSWKKFWNVAKLTKLDALQSREFKLRPNIRPLLDFGSCVWNFEYISDEKLQEIFRDDGQKGIGGFGYITYSQR